MMFYRKRTFQNVWRQRSGTFCTWTLKSKVLNSTPFTMGCHIFREKCRFEVEKNVLIIFDICLKVKDIHSFPVQYAMFYRKRSLFKAFVPERWRQTFCKVRLFLYGTSQISIPKKYTKFRTDQTIGNLRKVLSNIISIVLVIHTGSQKKNHS